MLIEDGPSVFIGLTIKDLNKLFIKGSPYISLIQTSLRLYHSPFTCIKENRRDLSNCYIKIMKVVIP